MVHCARSVTVQPHAHWLLLSIIPPSPTPIHTLLTAHLNRSWPFTARLRDKAKLPFDAYMQMRKSYLRATLTLESSSLFSAFSVIFVSPTSVLVNHGLLLIQSDCRCQQLPSSTPILDFSMLICDCPITAVLQRIRFLSSSIRCDIASSGKSLITIMFWVHR